MTTEEMASRLREGGLLVLDVRSAAEYAGLAGAPCDPRQGHLPGARNLDVNELLGMAAEELRDRIGDPAAVEVIAYCHSGNRSGLAVAVLRAAGYEARNYAGSWHAWSREPSLPIET